MSTHMKDFLDAVTNPFTANKPCQVPDGHAHETICLTDWIDQMSVVLDVDALTQISGIAFMFIVGNNLLAQEAATTSEVGYQVIVMPISNAGNIQTNIGATGLTSYLTANYQTLSGSATGYNDQVSLIDSFRLFGTGLRIWPAIEWVTSSDTPAVSVYYAGLLTPSNVYKSFQNGSNFWNVLRQSEHIQEFANSQGASVRLDPFDQKAFLEMRSWANWTEMISYDTSLMQFPIIACRFTESFSNGDVLPIRFMSQHWLEGQLMQPTPIFSSRPPMDLEYSLITRLISNNPVSYPIVVQGHSFKSFMNNVGKLTQIARKAYTSSSKMLPKGSVQRVVANTVARRLVPQQSTRQLIRDSTVAVLGKSKKARQRARRKLRGKALQTGATIALDLLDA